MTDGAPIVFDQHAIAHNLARAHGDGNLPSFLEELAVEELADRLALIKRRFLNVGIVSFAADKLEQLIRPALDPSATVTHLPVVSASELTLEAPKLRPESFDCLIVSASLEWVNDLPGTLSLLRRALQPDGVLLASMLGGDTLNELRQAWLQAESDLTGGASPRVAPFADVRETGSLLQRAGLALPVVDTDRLSVRYASALDLMRELKSTGLSNALTGRRRGLVPPRLLAAATAIYEANNTDPDGRVRATFQMMYLTGWAPHESQPRPLRPGSAKTSLAEALNVVERKLPKGE